MWADSSCPWKLARSIYLIPFSNRSGLLSKPSMHFLGTSKIRKFNQWHFPKKVWKNLKFSRLVFLYLTHWCHFYFEWDVVVTENAKIFSVLRLLWDPVLKEFKILRRQHIYTSYYHHGTNWFMFLYAKENLHLWIMILEF